MLANMRAVIIHRAQFVGFLDIEYDIQIERDHVTEEPAIEKAMPLQIRFIRQNIVGPVLQYTQLLPDARKVVDMATTRVTFQTLGIPFEEALDELLAKEEHSRDIRRARP